MSEEAQLERNGSEVSREGLGDTAGSPAPGAFGQPALSVAQLQSTLDTIPMYVWYATPAGVLIYVNERQGDYLGLPKDHPLRLGIEAGAAWDSYLSLIHPDDHAESGRLWSECLRTGSAGEQTLRIRNGQGEYRWFIGRAEPIRAKNGTLLYWMGVNLDVEERKKAEFYLLEAQRLACTGSWALNAIGFEYWSAQLFEICGLDPGGRAPTIPEYMELVHPEDRDFVVEEVRRMFSEHRGFDFTKRMVRPDGEVRYVRCVGVPADKGFVGTGIDVTEQEVLTRALRKSEAEFRQILDLTPQFITVLGPHRERLYINQIGLDHLGTTLDRWRDAQPSAELHPDDVESVQSRWNRAFLNGLPFECEFRSRRKDGNYRWLLARANPMRDEGGQVLRWYVAFTDIEERKQAEFEQEKLTEALRKSQEVLQQILDLTPHIVAVVGPGRERLYANQTALDYIGRTLEEWRKESIGTVHPDDFERLQSRWDGASSDCSAFELEVRIRRHDGVYRWFLARYVPVYEDEGKTLHWYSACTDIEDRKRDEERLQRENVVLREQINQASMFGEIVGTSAPLQKILTQVGKVAPSDSTVLVLGETGTGKELIARAIHGRSGRAARAFIAVNCAAIPASLIASELFGHEKGAFTGAAQRRLGRFEAANGGTIFLDEVGDLPMDIQIALLRVLQEHEIERIGRDKPVPVDVRVIAATHRDLKKLVREGKFRQDLFYRLNVVPITMPTLRERAADIPLLVEYFIARFGRKTGKTFRTIEKSTLEALKNYDWPGNVRELQNVIERAVTLSDSDVFTVDLAWLKREPSEKPHSSAALGDELMAHERDVIEAALAQSRGRVAGPTGAAARLGLPASTLDSKIARLGIDKYRFRAKPG